MDPKAGLQESEPNHDETAAAVADMTPSPGETEGTSSSEVAAEAKEEQTLAGAIRDKFLEKYGDGESNGEETPAPETKPEANAEQKPEIKADTDDSEDELRLTDDEFKRLPDRARQRIGQLNARAKKAERLAAERDQELETTRDSHQRMTVLHDFVEKNGIEPQNVTLAFDMMSKLARGDYEGFLTAISPFYDAAQQAAGRAIAADLRQKVEDGYMTEEAARELTQQRVRARDAEGRATRAQAQVQQTQQRDQASQQVNDIVAAVNRREAEIKAKDPEGYALRAKAVRTFMSGVLKRGGLPKSADDARALVDEAFEFATSTIPAPAAPQATPRTPPSAGSPQRSAPAPQSTSDAMIAAMENYRPAAR